MAGFFPLQRQIMDHWTYKNIYARSLWMHMLMVARYSKEPHTESYNGHLVTLNYGEFVFGRERWVKELEIPEQRMKTLLKKFIQENMIELRFSYPKGSVYTILNYSKFNQQSNQQSNQQQTLEPQGIEVDAIQQTNQVTNQQLTSNYPENNKVIRKQGIKTSSQASKTYAEDSIPFKMAKYLHDKIMEYAEEIKVSHLVKGANLQTWANDCRLILERDGRDKKEVFAMIEWIRKDDFWRTNILSPAKLRAQYVTIAVKMNSVNSVPTYNKFKPEQQKPRKDPELTQEDKDEIERMRKIDAKRIAELKNARTT